MFGLGGPLFRSAMALVAVVGFVALPAFAWASGETPEATDAHTAPPDAAETVSLSPGAFSFKDLEGLPRVLSDGDIALYRKIFEVQVKGEWHKADELIAKLQDRILLGHVMAQRYLHPTRYRSRYKELKRWLASYADHPEAKQLYKLALRRKPENWRAPKRPDYRYLSGSSHDLGPVQEKPPGKNLTQKQRRQVRVLKKRVRWYIRKGWTKAVKRMLDDREVKRLFSTYDLDETKARLAGGYFAAGRDEWALKWAAEAAKSSDEYLPIAHWTAGLAAWRLRRFEEAANHFEAMNKGAGLSPWTRSAAAFWAARSYLVNRNPEKVTALLKQAAAHQRTFYGLLASRILGLPIAFNWTTPPMNPGTFDMLNASQTGKRVLALLQVGQDRRAERELRGLAGRVKRDELPGILAIASRANMPALTVRINGLLYPKGDGFDGAAYPVPHWRPKDGFNVDRALIYALIRQESGFKPKAKSGAGARGLMQIMPRTASFVAQDRRYRWSKRKHLFEPEINLSLGQKYINILLKDERISGDLFMMTTAWNGGPGNLNKWRRKTEFMDDPLFFIESIPSRETRIFIERVMTNFWIYRDRLDQNTPSLDAIAAGDWPIYTALDRNTRMVAQNGENRRRTNVSAR